MREIQSISGSSQGCDSHSTRKDISRRDPGYYVPCHRRETCCRRSCRHSTDAKAMYMLMLTRRGTVRRLPTRLWWHHRNRKPPTTNACRKSTPHARPNDPAYHNLILAVVNRSPKSLLVTNLNYCTIRKMTRETYGLSYTAQGGKITKSKTAGIDLWLYIWKLSLHTSIRFLRNA